MEAMIDSGEEWLTPLLDYRDKLAATQDPALKLKYRDFRRRSGKVSFIGDTDRVMPGPYTMDFRRELLRCLLETQREVAAEAPPGEAPMLIHPEELQEIRRLWRTEEGDWADSVPRIVRDTLGKDPDFKEPDWVSEDAVAFTADDGELLNAICVDNDVPTELVRHRVSDLVPQAAFRPPTPHRRLRAGVTDPHGSHDCSQRCTSRATQGTFWHPRQSYRLSPT